MRLVIPEVVSKYSKGNKVSYLRNSKEIIGFYDGDYSRDARACPKGKDKGINEGVIESVNDGVKTSYTVYNDLI